MSQEAAWDFDDVKDWLPIEECPDYEVHADGRIRNKASGRVLRTSINHNGVVKVNMVKIDRYGSKQIVTRSVARLVALAHLDQAPPGHVITYVNSRKEDCHRDNLEWKPRWFVQEMAAQQKRTEPIRQGRILMEETGIIYDSSLECANTIGAIEKYIVLAASALRPKRYMGSYFRWMDV